MAKPTAPLSNDDSETLPPASGRSFGIVFAVVFGVIALWPLLWGRDLRLWSAALATVFALAAAFAPTLLSRPAAGWQAFGLVLHRIVSPVMLFLVYVLAVLPTGLLLRLFGKDLLRMKLDRGGSGTYWIERTPPGPAADSLKNTF
ncbi:MAG: SxtJ family membrane protein [bacterium]